MRKLLPLFVFVFVFVFGMGVAAPASSQQECCALDGTGDGIVDENDWGICAACIECPCHPAWDLTGDGLVSAADFVLVGACAGPLPPICSASGEEASVPSLGPVGRAIGFGLLAVTGALAVLWRFRSDRS